MQQPNQSATVDHIAKELLRIEREVREENGEAEQRLREKCRWERMSRTAVIREWGDPRNWTPQQGTMNPQTQPAITNSAQASNPLVIQPATVEECEFCTPAGYIPHHTYCPNKFRDEKVDAIILEAWQELKEKILCGESFAKRIKPFFARATESLRNESLTAQLKAEQAAHDRIASLCFALGAESGDGTSVAAVKSLCELLKAERERGKELEGAVKNLFSLPNWKNRCSDWRDLRAAIDGLHAALTTKEER